MIKAEGRADPRPYTLIPHLPNHIHCLAYKQIHPALSEPASCDIQKMISESSGHELG